VYLVPLIIILISLVGILFTVSKKIRSLKLGEGSLVYPEFKNEKILEQDEIDVDGNVFLKNFKIKKEGMLLIFMEKFFRRTRIKLMKIENFLTNLSDRIHEKSVERRKSDKESNGPRLADFNSQDAKFDESYWRKIIKHDPSSTYAYKKLGDIYSAKEDFHRARVMLTHALSLNPEDSEANAKIRKLKGKRTRK